MSMASKSWTRIESGAPHSDTSSLPRFFIFLIQKDECCYLKGQGHVTVKKAVTSIIYVVASMWPLCSAQILVHNKSTIKLSSFQNKFV